jgi:MATE family multidrug resistance protein
MWKSSDNWREEANALIRLAGPLMVNNLAIAGMQFTDTVMAGRLGAESLAAVAVGGSIWFLGFSVALGTLMAISPLAARRYGSGKPEEIGQVTRQGIYLGLGLGVLLLLNGQVVVAPVLRLIDISPDFRDLTIGYVRAITLGAPGICVFLVLRFTTEGIGLTRPIMYTSIFSLLCNASLNYVLMFGKLGAPALGATGCGLASALTMWFVMVVLAIYILFSPRYRPLEIFSRLAPLRAGVLSEIVFLGFPIAITIVAEAGLFNVVSVLMGTRGATITSAHQIAISFSGTMFMIPLALSSATTIRVGHALGAGNSRSARFVGIIGVSLCGAFMACAATFLLLFRDAVVVLYTNDVSIQGIAIGLLLMAAIFQVADGVQIGAAGALRGYKDTRIPMFVNMFAYWVIAFPLAYLAAVTYRLPPNYVWGGFIVGLTIAAILLTLRYQWVSKLANGKD